MSLHTRQPFSGSNVSSDIVQPNYLGHRLLRERTEQSHLRGPLGTITLSIGGGWVGLGHGCGGEGIPVSDNFTSFIKVGGGYSFPLTEISICETIQSECRNGGKCAGAFVIRLNTTSLTRPCERAPTFGEQMGQSLIAKKAGGGPRRSRYRQAN